MSKEFDEKLDLDSVKVHNAVKYQLPIEITTYTLPRNMEIYIREVMKMFITECHQEHMMEYLNFCNGELLINAKKANTKRVYFTEKGLDINNPDDYKKGMETFKEDTITNIDHYLELQKKAGYYIKFSLQLKGDQIKVEIRNNAKLTTFERDRINNKLNSVHQYNSMEEVFNKVLDQSEGAGLGIIIIVLMLSKIGLSKENYQVLDGGDETITRIVLPCNEKIFAGSEILTYEFVKMQEAVPVLKSHYDVVKQIVDNDKIDRQKLIDYVKNDATLYLLLLKQVIKNNPERITLPEILEDISDADLKNFFDEKNVGDENISEDEKEKYIYLVEDTEERTKLWEHAKNVALCAYNVVRNYKDFQNRMTDEQAYCLGLLNNIGGIFLACATKPQKEYVKDLCKQFEDTDKMIDVFYSGNAAPFISMIFTKRLGLADDFAATIGCWNNFEFASKKVLNTSKILYLAEILQLYDEKLGDFYQFDENTLNDFNIYNEEQFEGVLEAVKKISA